MSVVFGWPGQCVAGGPCEAGEPCLADHIPVWQVRPVVRGCQVCACLLGPLWLARSAVCGQLRVAGWPCVAGGPRVADQVRCLCGLQAMRRRPGQCAPGEQRVAGQGCVWLVACVDCHARAWQVGYA